MNDHTSLNSISENPDVPTILPEATLQDLPPKLQQAVIQVGWSELTPVQAKAMPYLFSRRDMMIQSRTGSGKTGAYLLPMLELLNPLQNNTQSLVLVPTRELALQVENEAKALFNSSAFRTIAVYGGVGYRDQFKAFEEGVHLVVGTPGRILDHLLRKSFTLDHLKILIFDEADRMLSMGFYPDMRKVQSYLPKNYIPTYMFSATFPPQVVRLSAQFMQSPGFLNLSSDHVHVSEVEHVYYSVPGMDKDRSLIRIIEVENPLSALIFCNTKIRVEYVTTVLQRFGYDADQLSSDLSQSAREKVMERIRQGNLRFLVATDVAARGIDLPELSHVIQYEPPEDIESYIHRAGRTGRAGASGTAISLVNTLEKTSLNRIEKAYTINFHELPLPTDVDVEKIVSERIIALLESQLRSRDKLQTERMQRFSRLANELGDNNEEKDLLAMVLDDFYQSNFHPNFTVSDSAPAQERQKQKKSGSSSSNKWSRRSGKKPPNR